MKKEEFARSILIDFLDDLKRYYIDGGNDLATDDRSSEALVDIFLQDSEPKPLLRYKDLSDQDIEHLAEQEYPDGVDGTDRSAAIYRRIFVEGFTAGKNSL